MIRICLFFSHDERTYVATYTNDEAAIAVARRIRASALFVETNVFGSNPHEIPKSAQACRGHFRGDWSEIYFDSEVGK